MAKRVQSVVVFFRDVTVHAVVGGVIIAEVHLYPKVLIQILLYLKPPDPLFQFDSHVIMVQIHLLPIFGNICVVMSLNTRYPLCNFNAKIPPSL